MATCRLPLVVVLGATGAGKSKLAIEIAKMFKGEIISADSMQIYKGLDIISNKVTLEEQQECPHHLISYLEADHSHYNVVDFRDAALPIIDDLLSKRILPVVVGGTNYYIESVMWNFLLDKKHSSSPTTQVEQVHEISSSETKNDISREQSRDSSRTSDLSATDLSLDHVHSGVDQLLVKCESVRTLKEKLSTQEMLTIAGFPKDADCSHHTPDLQQQSSLFQQTSSPPEQVLQSCSSYFEMQNHASSQVAVESLPGASPFPSGVHLLQRKVDSFSDNRETPGNSDSGHMQPLEAPAAHCLHRCSAASLSISSAQSLHGSDVDEGARGHGKVQCVSDAFIEDPSVPRVRSSACGETLNAEATFVHSGNSPVETGEQVNEELRDSPGFSHCDEFESGHCGLSGDISSNSSGLSCGVSSDKPGLLRSLSPDIHGLSCGVRGLLDDVHGLSDDSYILSVDSQGLSGDAIGFSSDAHGLTYDSGGLSSCETSDSSGLSQDEDINEAAQNPQDFRHDSNALLRCLNRMSSVDLYSHLLKIDPQTASRMHPNNRRKIVRAIQVYYECDRTMSSLLSEQHAGQDNVKSGPLRYPNPCILWVQCQQPDLNARLDGRVDDMVARGLLAELEHFHREAARLEALKRSGSLVDTGHSYTHGILQMIGFKEFHDYLQLSPEDRATDRGQKLLQQGVSDLKQATRQYARKQVRWITNRFCNRPGTNVPPIYSVDATDLTQWNQAVEEATGVVRAYIAGEVPIKAPETVVPRVDAQLVRNVCDLCGGRIFLHLHEWTDHLKSKKHKFNVKMLAKQRQQLSQFLSVREQQLKQMVESSNTAHGGPEGSSPDDSLCSASL